MKTFGGGVLFLDRDDINTDEIIPAKYLTEITKEALAPFLLEDLRLPGFDAKRDVEGKGVVISRTNFGCGSSREHAPWAFEMNGINVVIAAGFARIFRQNMFNCGMVAIEMDANTIDTLFKRYSGARVLATVSIDEKVVTFDLNGETERVLFTVGAYDEALIRAGGWVEYADANY